MLAVELRDLCKTFKATPVIEHLSLQIEAGEMLGVLGPPGAGKTTLLHMMSGLIAPDRGEIAIMGYRLPRELRHVQRLSGVVQQITTFYEDLTAWDNLAVLADLSGIPYKKKRFHIFSALMRLQLLEQQQCRVSTLSSAMKRRLALACALLTDPPLLYLDELSSGIDAQERFALWDYVRSLRTLNKTCVLATSSFEEACTLCDRIALIVSGKLLIIGVPEQFKQWYGDIVIELDLAHPFTSYADLETLQGVKKSVSRGLTLSITALDSRQVLPPLITLVAQECEIKALRVRAVELDEILPSLSRVL